jgi:YHS domain-containing protein
MSHLKVTAPFVLILGLLIASASTLCADNSIDWRTYTGPVSDAAQVCMVKRGVQASTPHTEQYGGKTYHFCCSGCLTRFRANPEIERFATDPVNGKKIDKADALIYSYQGRAYFLSSPRSLKKFAKKPVRYAQNN